MPRDDDARALRVGHALLAMLAALGLVPREERDDDMLRIRECLRPAGLRSERPLRDAIRRRELPAFGKQRDRCVRRSDLMAWVESRRLKPVAGPVDDDIDRRVRRLAAAEKERTKGRAA